MIMKVVIPQAEDEMFDSEENITRKVSNEHSVCRRATKLTALEMLTDK